jgi:hypothetical protein
MRKTTSLILIWLIIVVVLPIQAFVEITIIGHGKGGKMLQAHLFGFQETIMQCT